jgi:hypothetical protein
MDSANLYEWAEVADMLSVDNRHRNDDILALSRAQRDVRAVCHEAIREHLERSEARWRVDESMNALVWLNERGFRGRYCDRPAFISRDGVYRWYRNASPHRDRIDPTSGLHLPASIEWGARWCWYRNGRLHRDDIDPRGNGKSHLPAVVDYECCAWLYKGQLHREDPDDSMNTGSPHLPAIIKWTGHREWHRGDDVDLRDPKGILHLPAIIYADGTREWTDGVMTHRDDIDPESLPGSKEAGIGLLGTELAPRLLPAIIRADGTCEWWIDGDRVLPTDVPS